MSMHDDDMKYYTKMFNHFQDDLQVTRRLQTAEFSIEGTATSLSKKQLEVSIKIAEDSQLVSSHSAKLFVTVRQRQYNPDTLEFVVEYNGGLSGGVPTQSAYVVHKVGNQAPELVGYSESNERGEWVFGALMATFIGWQAWYGYYVDPSFYDTRAKEDGCMEWYV